MLRAENHTVRRPPLGQGWRTVPLRSRAAVGRVPGERAGPGVRGVSAQGPAIPGQFADGSVPFGRRIGNCRHDTGHCRPDVMKKRLSLLMFPASTSVASATGAGYPKMSHSPVPGTGGPWLPARIRWADPGGAVVSPPGRGGTTRARRSGSCPPLLAGNRGTEQFDEEFPHTRRRPFKRIPVPGSELCGMGVAGAGRNPLGGRQTARRDRGRGKGGTGIRPALRTGLPGHGDPGGGRDAVERALRGAGPRPARHRPHPGAAVQAAPTWWRR